MLVFLQNPFDNLPLEGYRKQRYWMMAEAFVRAGDRVVLWTSDFNHTTKRPRVRPDGTPLCGTIPVGDSFEVRLIPTRPYRKNIGLGRIASHRAYARAWERACAAPSTPRPDLIVTSVPTVSAAEAAFRLARACGARVVADVQDAWPETFERLAPHGFGSLARLLLAPLRARAHRLYREADRVTGVCERYRALTGRADYYRAYLGVEGVVGRSVPDRREGLPVGGGFQPPRDRARSPMLVYAGNLGVSYDLGTVLRGLGESTLDIAGKGAGEARWRTLVRDLGLENRVTFHGYLDERALRALLASCDIGIVPLAADTQIGVPNKLCEYAAAGLRIVSSLAGESADLLDRYACGATYAPGDAAAFAAAVRKAASLPRENALALARAEFDAVRIYDAYISEVKSLRFKR